MVEGFFGFRDIRALRFEGTVEGSESQGERNSVAEESIRFSKFAPLVSRHQVTGTTCAFQTENKTDKANEFRGFRAAWELDGT